MAFSKNGNDSGAGNSPGTTPDTTPARRAPRVLFYSHDTFGLGHLRRSRTIAAALTASDDQLSALIITGSTVAGRFTFPERVDYVRLPGVTKRSDGSYISEKLDFDIEETTVIRAGLIKSMVKLFTPDIIVVTKNQPVSVANCVLRSSGCTEPAATPNLSLGYAMYWIALIYLPKNGSAKAL